MQPPDDLLLSIPRMSFNVAILDTELVGRDAVHVAPSYPIAARTKVVIKPTLHKHRPAPG